MWVVTAGKDLQMTEGDYGIDLPIVIKGTDLNNSDSINFIVKTSVNGTTKLTKTFTNVQSGIINIRLTSSDANSLPVGTYVYSLDWYRSGSFMCNLVPYAIFKVVEKA